MNFLNGLGDWKKEFNSKKSSFPESQHFDNGDEYNGELQNGKRHGYGVYYYANGDRYEGEWVNGTKSGRGFHFWKD